MLGGRCKALSSHSEHRHILVSAVTAVTQAKFISLGFKKVELVMAQIGVTVVLARILPQWQK